MRTRFRSSPKMVGRGTFTWGAGRPPIPNAAEQSRRSWARRIDSYSAVPEVFKGFFEPIHADAGAFPYTVLTPVYEGFLRRETGKLVCVRGSEISVLERHGRSFSAKCYPLPRISHLEITTVLLDSRMSISGLTREQVAGVSTWRFNAVTAFLFKPIVRTARLGTPDTADRRSDHVTGAFAQWRETNYKFMNYARQSLLGCEQVYRALLQPEIRSYDFKILGRAIYKLISPRHASILTDRELIVIQESVTRGAEERYGGTWHFFPLHRIADLSLNRKDRHRLLFGVHPTDAASVRLVFDDAAEEELSLLVDRFRELSLGK